MNYQVTNFLLIATRQPLQQSFQSSQIPRKQYSCTGVIVSLPSLTTIIGAVYTQVRYRSSLFSRTNLIPLDLAHYQQTSYTTSRYCYIYCISLLTTSILRLSVNLIVTRPLQFLSSVYKLAVQRRNRISNRGEPYRTPIQTQYRLIDFLLKQRLTIQFDRQLVSQYQVYTRKPYYYSIYRSLV